MSTLRKAKASRRAYVTHLQRTILDLDNLGEPTDIAAITALKEKLLSSKGKLEDAGRTIVNLLEGEEDIEAEILEQESLSDLIIHALARIESLLPGDAPSEAIPSCSSEHRATLHHGLPKIALPTFDGDFLGWRPFYDQFRATVDSSDIPKVHKLTYLISALRGEARNALRGIQCTSDNYDYAIKTLRDRFGDPSVLIGLYADRLIHLPSAKENDIASFRLLIDDFESHLREMEQVIAEVASPKETSSSSSLSISDLLLAPLLSGKMPPSSQLEWVRRSSSPRDKFNLPRLLHFAKSEVEAREALACSAAAPTSRTLREGRKENATSRKGTPAAAFSALRVSTTACKLCPSNETHSPFACESFASLGPRQRFELVRKKGLCINCLGNHFKRDCTSKSVCRKCQGQHHTLLHRDISAPAESPPELSPSAHDQASPRINNVASFAAGGRRSVLQTALVRVRGLSRSARVLIDTGAEQSYVTQALVDAASPRILDRQPHRFESFGGGISRAADRDVCLMEISSRHQENWVSARLVAIPVICRPSHGVSSSVLLEIRHRYPDLPLADEIADEDLPIDILLGVDAIPQILLEEAPRFIARLSLTPTIFGHVVGGSIASTCPDCSLASVAKMLRASSMTKDVPKMWELDVIGVEPPVSKPPSPKPHHNGERYQISLPWLDERRPAMSADQADLRNNAFRRLTADDQMKYSGVFEEYHRLNILEPTINSAGNFIPHHAVLQKGKLRVVYDASAKPWKGPCLNDCLDPGPNLLQHLVSVLIRLRTYEYPLIADVEKAFLMVSVDEADRDYLKIVWIDASGCRRYSRFTRVPFGLNCGPFLLLTTIRAHLDSLRGEDESLAGQLSDGLYMDDLVTGASSTAKLLSLREGSQRIFREAGMNLRKFTTIAGLKEFESDDSIPLNTKVLGLSWNRDSDSLTVPLDLPPATTRRQVASAVASVFDPLGIASPWTISARIFLQRLWKECEDWDSPMPRPLQLEYDDLLHRFTSATVTVPRHVSIGEASELHVFADASQRAYAAALFVKTVSSINLLCSRARVAPLTPTLTIPRLELLAALLAARLASFVSQFLRIPLRVRFYTDSTIALSWIRKPPADVFVRNRVREILTLTGVSSWSHVDGQVNPADLPTRGVDALDTESCYRWFHGPAFIKHPSSRILLLRDRISPRTDPHEDLCASRFSTLSRAVRTVAWILRFCHNARANSPRLNGELHSEELSAARIVLLRNAQQAHGQEDFARLTGGDPVSPQSLLWNAQPSLNADNRLIVCSPRTGGPKLPWLPAASSFARLVILDVHHRLYHLGVPSTTNEILRSFCIPRCRRLVKKIIYSCVRCRRINARPPRTIEGPLPALRTTPARPFECAGLDHFGPLFLKDHSKVWVLLFTCAVTRAIHLEAVVSLDSQETGFAIRRFFARRGKSAVFLSDNGRSFVHLSKLMKGLVEWRLIPPAAPWWG